MNSIGFMLAYMNTMNYGDDLKGYKGIAFGVGLIVSLIILIPYVFDRIAQSKFSSDGWARILIFPCVWTGIWTIFLFSWPLGDWGNYAFTLLNYEEIMQLASFAGLGGINFILSWSGPIGSDIIYYHVTKNQNSFTPTTSTVSIVVDEISIEDNSVDNILRHPPTQTPKRSSTLPTFINSLSIYIIVLFLVITYGSIRLNTSFIPFYQKSIQKTFPQELVNFGCVLGNSDNQIYDYMSYVNLTQNLAISGNKIILCISYNVYIGFTYADATNLNGTIYNKQVVINNKGDVVIDYKKSNLVPFVEAAMTKGNNKLQTFQSEDFGIIGSAVCFDFNFPKLIGQASSKKVNLMLDSSDTWLANEEKFLNLCPVGPLHSRMNSIRSIENGFTIFRCNSVGVSGIWNQYGQPLHSIPTVNTNTTTFQFPVNMVKNRVKTVYSVFGETFGWICVGGIIIYLIVIVVAIKGSDQWKARIIHWS
ncbi:carbon-nitrogen hydrolase [Rhizophagus diaphanus]|nr:carbon-nitrogen hydrolase [Rhizophagus diaphanus] [Rhizophagus sp. MUCL 43196]